MRSSILFFVLLLVFSSCKKDISYEFVLSNESQRMVFMNVQQLGSLEIDTNLISPGTALVLGVTVVEARNGKRARDRVEVPFAMLQVMDLDGNVPSLCDEDLNSMNCWIVPEGRRGISSYGVRDFFNENSFD